MTTGALGPSRLLEQGSAGHRERLRQLLDHGDGRVALTALDVADISAVDTGAVGIVLLAPASLFTEAPYIPAKANAYFHVA